MFELTVITAFDHSYAKADLPIWISLYQCCYFNILTMLTLTVIQGLG